MGERRARRVVRAVPRRRECGPRPGSPRTGSSPLVATDGEDRVVITGDGFAYTFDKTVGTLASMRVGNDELLHSGPELDVWRAPISNESSSWGTDEGPCGAPWGSTACERRSTASTSCRTSTASTITARTTVAAPDVQDASFAQTITTSVDRTGTVQLTHHVEPLGDMRALPYLPRIGLQLRGPGRVRHVRVVRPWPRRELPRPSGRHTDRRLVDLGRRAVRRLPAPAGPRQSHGRPMGRPAPTTTAGCSSQVMRSPSRPA